MNKWALHLWDTLSLTLEIGDILNVLLYTGTNFEDLSRKHMQF